MGNNSQLSILNIPSLGRGRGGPLFHYIAHGTHTQLPSVVITAEHSIDCVYMALLDRIAGKIGICAGAEVKRSASLNIDSVGNAIACIGILGCCQYLAFCTLGCNGTLNANDTSGPLVFVEILNGVVVECIDA